MQIAWFVLGAFVVIAIAEMILSAKWSPFYVTKGIPVFIRRIDRPQGLAGVDLEALAKSAATVAGAPFLFRWFGDDTIAFREKSFSGAIHYFSLMRGLIRRRAGEPQVVVTGLLSWWALALLAGLVIILGRNIKDVVFYPVAAYAVLYFIQAVRFNRIAKALRSGERKVDA